MTYKLSNPDALSISGNCLMRDGKRFTLRGVSICSLVWSDPTTLLNNLFSDNLNINVVRIPVHAQGWDKNNAVNFIETKLKPAINQVLAAGHYVIIDWHPVIDWTAENITSANDFWKIVAPLFADNPKVLFEIFNEPVNNSADTVVNWKNFRDAIQPVIDTVRTYAPYNIIIVGSPSWTTRIKYAADYPLVGGNIMYSFHNYPNYGKNYGPALQSFLESEIPFNRIPVFFTEFGFESGAHSVIGIDNNPDYPVSMNKLFIDHPNVCWTAWSYDTACKPAMLSPSGANMKTWVKNMLDKPVDYIPLDAPLVSDLSQIQGNIALWDSFRSLLSIPNMDEKVLYCSDASLNGFYIEQQFVTKQASIGPQKKIGDKKVLNFQGGKYYFITKASELMSGKTKLTIALLFDRTQVTSDRRLLNFGGNGSINIFVKEPGQFGLGISTPGSTTAKYAIGSKAVSGPTLAIVTIDTIMSIATIQYTGQSKITVTGFGTSAFPLTGMTGMVGALIDGGASFVGGLGFIAIYDRILNNTEQLTVARHAKEYWGVSL